MIVIGVTVATTSNFFTTMPGTLIGLASALSISLYQIVGSMRIRFTLKIKYLKVYSRLQEEGETIPFLFYQNPLAFGLLVCSWPWVEDVSTILQYPEIYDIRFLVCILLQKYF